MSELGKLIKKVEQQRLRFEEAQRASSERNTPSLTHSQSLLDTLDSINNILRNDVLPNAHKFNSKRGVVDPITGTPRYGAETEAKIAVMYATAVSLQHECETLTDTLRAEVKVLADKEAHNERERRRLEPSDILSTQQTAGESSTEELERKRREEEERILHEKEINKRAALIREKKAQEIAEQCSFDNQILSKLRSVERWLNESRSKSDESLQRLLGTIHSHCTSPGDPAQSRAGRDMLNMVVDILDRIVNRPDDAACRKLRLTHPALMAKLTGRFGGIELLSLLGFRLQCAALPDTVIKATHTTANREDANGETKFDLSKHEDQRVHSKFATTEIRRLLEERDTEPLPRTLDLFSLLAPHTVWEAVFEMHEPALELSGGSDVGATNGIGGKGDWISWFDGLTRHREIVRQQVEAWGKSVH